MGQNNKTPSAFVWMDGKLLPYANATIPVLSHSFQYGTLAFEGMRVYSTANGKSALFRAKEHFRRLRDSIHSLGFTLDISDEELLVATRSCLEANKLKEGYVRPFVYIDDSYLGLGLPENVNLHIGIAAWSWPQYMGEGQENGITTVFSTYRRPDIASALPQSKLSGNYLLSVMARREALLSGADEAILLDLQGFVAEGPGENIFIIRDGIVYTPKPHSILPGITRDTCLELLKGLKVEVREQNFTRNQVYLAEEIFMVGTAVEVTPVIEVDHRERGSGKPGAISQKVVQSFASAVRGKSAEYGHWLTYL